MEAIGKIISSVISSLLVSIILFLVTYSFMTGEFPPNLARLKKGYQNLHEMAKVSRQIHEKDLQLRKQYQQTGAVSDEDLQALQELNLRRADIGTNLLGATSGSSDEVMQRQIHALEKRVSHLEAELKRQHSK